MRTHPLPMMARQATSAAPLDAVAPGFLHVGPTSGQVGQGRDLVVDDGAVAKHGAHGGEAPPPHGREEGLQPVVAHDHWAADYADAAAKGGLEISLSEAVAHVQAWVDEIDSAE